jgi:hypothetical protein
MWNALKPWLTRLFALPDNLVRGLTPSQAAQRFINAVTDYTRVVFIAAPPSTETRWSTNEKM